MFYFSVEELSELPNTTRVRQFPSSHEGNTVSVIRREEYRYLNIRNHIFCLFFENYPFITEIMSNKSHSLPLELPNCDCILPIRKVQAIFTCPFSRISRYLSIFNSYRPPYSFSGTMAFAVSHSQK